jgi:hypothetical protein
VPRKLLQLTKLKREAGENLMVFEVLVKGQKLKGLVDSGANGNFFSNKAAARLNMTTVAKTIPDTVRLANGQAIDSTHVTRVSFGIEGYKDLDTFHLIDLELEFDLVLGKPWLKRMNPDIDWRTGMMKLEVRGKKHKLLPMSDESGRVLSGLLMSALEVKRAALRGEELFLVSLKRTDEAVPDPPATAVPGKEGNFPVGWRDKVAALLARYEDVVPTDPDFQPGFPPERSVDHKVELIPGAAMPNKPTYRMSPVELEDLKKQIEDMLERGFIQPSISPYGSPIIMVKKPDGSYRLCVDYRVLNSATIRNAYPVPSVHELLDRLHGVKCMSKIDLAQGYHQLRMSPESVPLTAFRCRYGLFEYKVMPFGLCNAPGTFQKLMSDMIMPHMDDFVVVYLDDLLIYSKTPEEHLDHVEKVLGLLREQKLYARPSKCEFGVDKMKFLGHVVSSDGIHTDPAKIQAIQDWPIPKSVKEVLQFKGLAEFYRRFVKEFSRISAPLSALTGNVPFLWGKNEQTAFEQLKYALTHAPILAPPDFSKQFLVTCDASKFAIGAVLSQGEGKDMRVVAYESRKMIDAETRYEVHDKELLAVIHALKKWHYYLRGKRFVIVTDNWATKFIQTKPHLTQRQMSWMSTLQEFDCDIVHRPGKTNIVADALSRRPDFALNALTWIKPDDGLFATVKRTAEADPEHQRVLAAVTASKRVDFKLTDGLLYKGARLYVPEGDLRHKLLFEAHDAPLSGHLGRDKTYERLSRAFYWPKMHHMVYEYCKTCPSCQAIKPSHQAKMGLLQPLPIPSQPGESWGMDFIMALPPTKRGHTAICTFVDRLTKLMVLVPTTVEVTAEETAYLFHGHVFRHYGMATSLVSDRDPRFTSEFWTSLHKRYGTKLNMSTANHPQTDGQSENANKTIEDMVRAYVSPYHDDWDEHLVTLEFAYNDSVHASTGYTPFFLNRGRHPRTPLNMFLKPDLESPTESVKAYAARLRVDIERAREAMLAAQARQQKYANRSRRDVTFQVGDKVWLATSHLRFSPAHNAKRKLQPRFFGPYPVKKVLSDVAYELELPAKFRIHPVIHISHLKANADGTLDFPSRPDYVAPPPPEVEEEGGEEYFKVEAFRNKRGSGGREKFLVKWMGYGEDQNEWLSAKQLKTDMPDEYESLVSAYNERIGAKL